MTEGEATGSIDILEKENSLRKNQRDQTKRNFEIREHKARAAGGRYATRALGGDEIDVTLGYSGVVNRANESFANHNVVVASIDTPPGPRSGNSPGQTRITFTMKDAPEETGLRVPASSTTCTSRLRSKPAHTTSGSCPTLPCRRMLSRCGSGR
jgi:hypothetical protein